MHMLTHTARAHTHTHAHTHTGQVLKEQLAQQVAARNRAVSAEHSEYAKNVVVTYLETRDASLLPALRQAPPRRPPNKLRAIL